MQVLKRWLAIVSVALLSACASVTEIKDFTDRSVAYGWVDIKDVSGNHVSAVYIQQYRPKTDSPYYTTGIKEFKDGILFWSIALPVGSHKLDTIKAQSCLGFLCGNTVYSYSFGKQGDEVGALVIKAPGVYHLGSYKLKDVKTGWLEEGKFQVVPAGSAPSRREMLEEILRDRQTQETPVIVERIKRELARL